MAREKHDYFKAFEQQAKIALAEADLLIEAIENFTTADAVQAYMPKAHELENEADEINHANHMAIAVDFVTPIDRDDLIGISQALDQVVDDIEDIIQEFYIMNVHFMHKDALELAQCVRNACQALCEATSEFSNYKRSTRFRPALVDVNTYEEEADKLYAKLIRNLHTQDEDNPMRVLVWSRIFTKMERCTDTLEHAADKMDAVLLKNS